MPRRRASLLQPGFPPTPAVTEGDVQRKITEYLERCGLTVWRADASLGRRGGRNSRAKGLPDLFGVLPGGRWFAIEVKKPGAKPRANEEAQVKVIAHLTAHGALVVVARSVEDVARVIGAGGSTSHLDRREIG